MRRKKDPRAHGWGNAGEYELHPDNTNRCPDRQGDPFDLIHAAIDRAIASGRLKLARRLSRWAEHEARRLGSPGKAVTL